jgi:hypothetical protein
MTKARDIAVEDRMADLFQPDIMLASQFFDRLRRRSEYVGERRLMIAVLEDAIDVYRKQAAAKDGHGRNLFNETEEWFEAHDHSWLYGFENICDVLDLDAEYIRRGLHGVKARARSGQAGVVVELRQDEDDEPRRAAGD